MLLLCLALHHPSPPLPGEQHTHLPPILTFSRERGILSRGVAATEDFFANGSKKRKNRRQAKSDESEARGSKGEGPRSAAAVAAAAAAAKLEGEEEAREAEGLRVVPRHVAFVMDGNGRW